MSSDFEQRLERFADLTVQVGLNLQPGQRLIVTDPSLTCGVALEAAPLVRRVAASAYRAGARRVDVIWGDAALTLARFAHAPADSFDEYPTWYSEALLRFTEEGGALLSIHARNPDLLAGQAEDRVNTAQTAAWTTLGPVLKLVSGNGTNWCVIAAPVEGWAAKVFPDRPAADRMALLWEQIFRTCRIDQPDPIAAWEEHLRGLAARSAYLNARAYHALRFRGTGTDLTVGLPQGHIWKSGKATSAQGIAFTANLPTEEVFTMPHRARVEGHVRASKPLAYGGSPIEGIELTFEAGRVVRAEAATHAGVLRKLIETDEGAARLGEVALVPHGSPIAQSGLLFFNTLFDENAASHLAFGRAYKMNLRDGGTLSDEDFTAAGGNSSLVHVDFMIGAADTDVDGLNAAGEAEPVMRAGEWAFEA